MSTTSHPYAHILVAIAEGKNVQWQESSGGWSNQSPSATLAEISSLGYAPERYRVHVKTMRINGHEVSEPLRELPADDARVFWPSLGLAAADDWTSSAFVGAASPDSMKRLLDIGVLHDNREAAAAHARALISLTAPKLKD